jgi:hypothetical protein
MRGKLRPTLEDVKARLAEDRDFLRPIVEAVLQELLEAETTEALGAGAASGRRPGAATAAAIPPRSSPGSASWSCGCRRTAGPVLDRAVRALPGALRRRSWRRSPRCTSRERSGAGTDRSTRKIKVITEELCGHAVWQLVLITSTDYSPPRSLRSTTLCGGSNPEDPAAAEKAAPARSPQNCSSPHSSRNFPQSPTGC